MPRAPPSHLQPFSSLETICIMQHLIRTSTPSCLHNLPELLELPEPLELPELQELLELPELQKFFALAVQKIKKQSCSPGAVLLPTVSSVGKETLLRPDRQLNLDKTQPSDFTNPKFPTESPWITRSLEIYVWIRRYYYSLSVFGSRLTPRRVFIKNFRFNKNNWRI